MRGYRMRDAPCRIGIPRAGWWMPDSGCLIQGTGYLMLDDGCGILLGKKYFDIELS
ncbi:MAG: hypothetical protein ABI760_12035 [Ferruginibacter sp.]